MNIGPLDEEAIMNHQEILIKALFGDVEAKHANYGWAVDEQEHNTVVTTKIYAWGFLTTSVDDGVIMDAWEPFPEKK